MRWIPMYTDSLVVSELRSLLMGIVFVVPCIFVSEVIKWESWLVILKWK